MRHAIHVILLVSLGISGYTQNIQISNTDLNFKTYGNNSGLSVRVGLKSCFSRNNQFKLQLSNTSGIFDGGSTILKTYNGHFLAFMNGPLPNVPASKNYKLRVISTSPADTSNEISGFEVVGTPFNPQFVLGAGSPYLINDTIFGSSTANKALSSASVDFEYAQPGLASVFLTKPEIGSTSLVTNSKTFTLQIDLGAYWIITLVASQNSIYSQKSYLFLNTTNTTSLTNNNSEIFCNPDNAPYTVDTSKTNGIGYNYPGSYYRFTWGDNSTPTEKTHCQILQNNIVSHSFSNPSCGTTTFNAQDGKYTVKQDLFNPEGQNFLTEVFSTKTSSPVVYKQPKADFTYPSIACINSPIQFLNNSTPGAFYDKNISVCAQKMKFQWRVDDVRVRPETITGGQNWAEWPNLNYTFSQPGLHKIALIAQNDVQSNCSGDSIIKYICIEAQPNVKFQVNAKDSLAECATASLSVKTTNTTSYVSCNIPKWRWLVYDDSTGVLLSPPTDYKVNSDTAKEPTFTFTTPRRYRIELQVTNSCGTYSATRIVKLLATGTSGGVRLPPAIGYCTNTKTIDFGTDGAHKPTYASNEGDETYSWSVSGSTTFSFQTGTNVPYPKISFTDYGVYMVKVTFTNKCGTGTATQQITLSQPVTVDAGPPSASVCFNQNTFAVTGTVTPSTKVKWTSSGTGSFTADSLLSTNYNISSTDKLKGSVLLSLSAVGLGACTGATDTLRLTIFPENAGTPKSDTICSGSKLSYAPVSTVAGSSFSWTSKVTKGNVSGNTASGSGNITDVLTNNDATTIAEVVYTVTPKANNCNGPSYTYTVSIQPNPVIDAKANPATICSGTKINIELSSNLSSTKYSWTSSLQTGTANGNTSLQNQNGPINDLLTNTGSIDAIVRYTITGTGPSPAYCTSNSKVVDITVTATATRASAGPDQFLCDASQTSLAGNSPTTGTGTWTQVAGPAVFIDKPNVNNPTVSGLTAGNSYKFVWTIQSTNSACGNSSDTVDVFVRPKTTKANAGKDSSFCSTGINTYKLQGNNPATFETGTWSIINSSISPNPSFDSNNKPDAILQGLKAGTVTLKWQITSDAAACGSTADTILLTIGASTEPAFAGNDTALCNINSIQLNATTVKTPSSGVWTTLGSATLQAPSTANSGVNGLVYGDNLFVWTVTNSLCSNANTDTVNIIVRKALTIATAGKDTTFCGSGGSTNYKLQGNSVAAFETGEWIVVSNSMNSQPQFSNKNDPASVVSNLTPGVLVLKWSIKNDAGCTPSTSQVKITIAGSSENASAGNDIRLCSATTATLNATPVTAPSKGAWTVISPAGIQITDTANPQTTISGLPIGISKLLWTVTNNVCAPKSDTVIIEVSPALSNKLSTAPQTICSGQSATITGQVPTGGNGSYTYLWQQSSSGSGFTDIPGETSQNITVSPAQNTFYRRYVKSLPCEAPSDTVLVTVLAGISSNTIGSSQSICINTKAATIKGQIPGGGGGNFAYAWESSTNGGTNWQPIAGATAIDYDPGVLVNTTSYRRLVTTQLCNGAQGNASNIVTITVNPDAKAEFNPLTTRSCAPFVINSSIINLTPYNDRNGNFLWSANGKQIGNGNFPVYTLGKAGDSVQIGLIAVSKFGCKNDTTAAWFYSPENPAPAFKLSDTVGCGPLAVTIANNTPNAALYRFVWDFGNGITSNQQDPGTIVFKPNPLNTDTIYRVTMKATGGCDTITVVQSIRVKSKPKALFTPSKVIGCSPMTVTFTNTSRGTNANFTWDFGDGSPQQPASGISIQHTFYTGVLDTFFVKLFGQNECGIDTQQYAIVVNPNTIKLNMAVNGNQVNGCVPQQILFVNNTKGANIFRWNFGDGSPELITTKGIDSVTHTYTASGNYTVALAASNSCSDTSTSLAIRVETKPVVAFTQSATNSCIGQSIQFTNTGDQNLSYLWKFGDASTSNSINPQKTFSKSGTYHVVLIGTKTYAQGFGCSDSASADIIVRDTIAGHYTVDSTSSCAPMFVVFKNTNKPSVNTTWDFGDGTAASGDSVVHTFNLSGTYRVSMLAQSPGGCKYLDEKDIVVNGPSGELLYNAGFACLPNQVSFEVNSNNTSIYKFYFGNGDSIITTNSRVNYLYPKPGNYLPYVILTTGNCSRKISKTDTVKVDRVKAGLTTASQFFCGKTIINFNDTSAAYFGIKQWYWDFGDGTSSPLKNPVKQYTSSGNFNITLRTSSASGCTDEIVVPLAVTVNNIPVSQITNDALTCTANNINFSANVNSADAIASYNWNFGNGATAQGQNVTYTYSNANNYTITLISRTSAGCADTVKKVITVKQSPNVVASADARICLGQATTLSATGSNQLSWSPQQGLSCTSCASTLAKPTVTTLYIVTGVNADGCPDTDTVLVDVVQPFRISVTPNDTLCIGNTTQLFASGASYYRWNPAIGLSSSSIPNPIAKPATTTGYTVVGYDNYNCFTDTAKVEIAVGQYPVVNIGNGAEVVAGTAITFTPVITNGPISKYVWDPPTWLSCINCATPVATINYNISYQLTVTNIYGCSGTDTISYQVLCSQNDQVYIPNAFSPDGDGINDVFMLHGKGIVVDYFRVFNRWGQLVFDGGSNYQPNVPKYGWDGRINGKPATQDVYVYMVKVKCTAGGTFTYKGNVSLLYLR